MAIAHANTVARPEPTEAELRTAWQRSRKPGWPATFEDAISDPFYARILRTNALHPPAAPLQVVRPPWPFMAGRVHRQPASQPNQAQPARVFDIKRAAAGDLDED